MEKKNLLKSAIYYSNYTNHENTILGIAKKKIKKERKVKKRKQQSYVFRN